MNVKRTKSIGEIFGYLFILLSFVAFVGFIVYFTNGFTSDFVTFYVKVDGGKTVLDTDTVVLPQGQSVRFDTVYTFEGVGGTHRGFKYIIVPHVSRETDFDFYVDGNPYSFSAEKDLSVAFDVNVETESLTIINNDLTIESILGKVYEGHSVEVPKELNTKNLTFVDLIISTPNDRQSVVIGLRFSVRVTGIEIDNEGVII